MFRTSIRLAAVALVAFASVAQAQRPVFGVAAGLTAPQSDMADVFESGYHVGAAMGFRVPVLPVDLRADLAWNSFGGKEGVGADLSVLNLTVNAQHTFPGVAIRPYVIGGLGMYRSAIKPDAGDDITSTDLGFNAGAGVQFKLAGIQSFVEARYHMVQVGDDISDESAKLVPISFGIIF